LPLHAIDLFPHRVAELAVAGGPGAIGLLRDDGERRLEAVCEVAGLRDRARDGALAMVEQRVEIVDQRLHLLGVFADDAAFAADANARQAMAELHERSESA